MVNYEITILGINPETKNKTYLVEYIPLGIQSIICVKIDISQENLERKVIDTFSRFIEGGLSKV